MKKILTSFIAFAMAGALNLQAQNLRTKENRIVPAYQHFKNSKEQPTAGDFFGYLHATYKLSSQTTFALQRSTTDNLGMVHERYTELYNGHPVEGGTLILHKRGDKVESFSADLFGVKGPAAAVVTEGAALTKALTLFNADQYSWQSGGKLGKAQGLPKGELVWAPEKGNHKQGAFVLAWKFDIYALKPLKKAYVYIDAQDGHVLWERNALMDVHTNGQAMTKYSSLRTLVTDSLAPNSFTLEDETRGSGIGTYDLQNDISGGYYFENTSNWWADTAGIKGVEYDVHWGLQRTYDYYDSVHSRSSYDNMGGPIMGFVHYDVNYANAFWDGTEVIFGDGNPTTGMRPLTSLDIVGHELTHGVTQYTAGLDYDGESGALNESFSDIFGKTIEQKYKPATFSWTIAKEIYRNGQGFRSMSSPKNFTDPNTYMGQYWYTGLDDNGGVHTNSGVQNFWYYLLSVGKSGTNDLSQTYNVTGIGTDKAAAIAYRSLSTYLMQWSDYQDARASSIQAAEDLFGTCSNEVIQTTNAWYAVGVGNKYPPANIVTASAALPDTAIIGDYIQLNSTATNATTLAWYKDALLISNLTNDSCSFSTTGAHEVTLVAANNICSDTLVHSLQVKPAPAPPNLSIQGNTLKQAYQVYPNPASGLITLEGAGKAGSRVSYKLVDVSGRVVAAKSITVTGSSFKDSIITRQLAGGIYSLIITDAGQTSTIQVMIKN